MESELPLGGSSSTGHLSTAGVAFASGGTGRMHHSLSTPAGVDCGGGSQGLFRTPPATPKKGGKMLAVRVQMLDDSITMFQVQAKALGRVLFDQVCRQLHLLEADYFGLEYQELGGTKYWLDLEKPVCRQVGLSLIDPLLRFCVKFYTPGPAQLEEEFTRYLFCLQVKRDLAHGCIQCNENTSALMASYIVQAECGDFVPEDYPDHTYLSSYKFFPLQDADLERRIMENHKKHMGQSPAEADLNLLETARRCELYGMKMHPAKDHEGVPLNIAVAHLGIVVFQHLTKINTFSWAKIRKISFKRKRFLIKLHPEGYGYYKDLVEFFFEGRNECKNFWKKCVENHGFFRCSSVKRVPRHRTRVLSRGSSFRYSGRTQKQIVEFVRDNYVKRQTFQRSQSFRVSRSLRSSRANVSSGSANLVSNNPNSVSAHPLLPLPPGSNAISLEWDKQPQYLEASLMMKGYTGEGEAARQAMTLVERQRRRSEGATALQTRQPDTPMNSAATRDQGTGLVTHVEVNHHRMEDSPPPHPMTTPLGSPESTWSRSTSPHSSIITTSTTRVLPHHQTSTPAQPPLRSRPSDATPTPSDGLPKDETDKMDTSAEGFFLLPQSPASKQERSFFASTPKAENGLYKQMIPPRSPTIRAPGELADDVVVKMNGLDKQTGVSRGQLNSDSSYSIDVLSGGESECESLRKRRPGKDDTLGRLMKSPLTGNGVINTEYTQTGTETFDAKHGKRHHADKAFYIAKELLMTERTYKKDLEVITVWLRGELSSEIEEDKCRGPLWAPLEALAVSQAGVLRVLEARLASRPSGTLDNNNSDTGLPMQSLEANRTGTLMLAFLKETLPWYEKWILEHLISLQRLEEACHNTPSLERLCRDLEHYQRACYLPISTFALKPLYRLLHYRRLLNRASELHTNDEEELEAIKECVSRLRPVCEAVESALPDSLNYCHLCLLHRDIDGFDNLVLPERQFIRQGCLFKHSNKGPQQRMFFLFSDILVYGSKGSSSQQQFRVHGVIPLASVQVEQAEYNNSFTLYGGGRAMTLSSSTSSEKDLWMNEIERTAEEAKNGSLDSIPMARSNSTSGSAEELNENAEAVGAALQRSNTLAHVCWHRNASLSWRHLETAMENQLSGYLLRKFKNSLGWQKLWVVFASFCLYFYKSSNDDFPLASLPLLGYLVTTPNERDGINKDFVFKLVFKNHVYFFRAESDYTFERWMEVINSATTPPILDDRGV